MLRKIYQSASSIRVRRDFHKILENTFPRNFFGKSRINRAHTGTRYPTKIYPFTNQPLGSPSYHAKSENSPTKNKILIRKICRTFESCRIHRRRRPIFGYFRNLVPQKTLRGSDPGEGADLAEVCKLKIRQLIRISSMNL